jgi:hypothetical protein
VKPTTPEELYAVLASPDGLTARTSSFARPEVIREVAAALTGGGSRDQIETLTEAFLAKREVVPLLAPVSKRSDTVEPIPPIEVESVDTSTGTVDQVMRRSDGKTFPSVELREYTTAELLATEQAVIETALTGVGAGRWTAPGRLVDSRLRRHRHLTEGQREMVRRFATSGNTVDVGVGDWHSHRRRGRGSKSSRRPTDRHRDPLHHLGSAPPRHSRPRRFP